MISDVKHYFFAWAPGVTEPFLGVKGLLSAVSLGLAGHACGEKAEHFNTGTENLSVLSLKADFLSQCLSPLFGLVPFLSDALK